MSQMQERWPPQGLPAADAAIDSGILAARPAFGNVDAYYWATDIFTLFRDTGVAWEVVSAQFYRRYISTMWIHGGSPTTTLDGIGLVYYSPIVIERTVTVDRIGIVTGPGATGNFYLAIYDSVGELPVNRIGVTASTAHVVNQKFQVPLTVATLRLTPGYYHLAVEADNITDQFTNQNLYPLGMYPPGVADGPWWLVEDLGVYLIPPVVATPVLPVLPQRGIFMWLRAVSFP